MGRTCKYYNLLKTTCFMYTKRYLLKYICFIALLPGAISTTAQSPSDWVNPFIGTSNFGATHPGAQYPHALASVTPFNVAFREGAENPIEKDAGWNSRSYIQENGFLTGFSHANLSGVGCPELGVLLLMPTTGERRFDPAAYGSTYQDEEASPGYYSCYLNEYDIKAEVSSTLRTGISRYTFPAGESHIPHYITVFI